MPNFYPKSSYWENLTFSKLRFSKFKKFALTFKVSCCSLKIRGLGKDIRDVFIFIFRFKDPSFLKSDSQLQKKKSFLFASMVALQKWWKMLFISS